MLLAIILEYLVKTGGFSLNGSRDWTMKNTQKPKLLEGVFEFVEFRNLSDLEISFKEDKESRSWIIEWSMPLDIIFECCSKLT